MRSNAIFTIHAKEWHDKVNGNSYFACRIFKDTELLAVLPFQYGYGNQYEHEAMDILERAEKFLGREHYQNGGAEPLWQYMKRTGEKYHSLKEENCLKRDVITWGEQN